LQGGPSLLVGEVVEAEPAAKAIDRAILGYRPADPQIEPDERCAPHPGQAASPPQLGREAEQGELVAKVQHRPAVHPGRRPDLGQVHHALRRCSSYHEHN
jgi:hypothetical protein